MTNLEITSFAKTLCEGLKQYLKNENNTIMEFITKKVDIPGKWDYDIEAHIPSDFLQLFFDFHQKLLHVSLLFLDL